MSKISLIYDAILVRLQAIFPDASGWNRLTNPYVIDDNNNLYLRQGYGFTLGAAVNRGDSQCPLLALKRQVSVVVSRRVDSTEMGVTEKDTAHKSLLEDCKLVMADFELNFSLGPTTANMIFQDDSGLQFVRGENENFIYCQMNFSCDYFENLVS